MESGANVAADVHDDIAFTAHFKTWAIFSARKSICRSILAQFSALLLELPFQTKNILKYSAHLPQHKIKYISYLH